MLRGQARERGTAVDLAAACKLPGPRHREKSHRAGTFIFKEQRSSLSDYQIPDLQGRIESSAVPEHQYPGRPLGREEELQAVGCASGSHTGLQCHNRKRAVRRSPAAHPLNRKAAVWGAELQYDL